MLIRLVQFLAVVFLSVVVGGAAVFFDFAPGPQLKESFTGMRALLTQSRQQRNRYNASAIYKADETRRGVTRHVPESAFSGYTLFAMGHGNTVMLLDMRGEPVHQWFVNYLDIWEPTGDVKQPVPGQFINVRKAALQPDGGLLVIFSAWTTTPYGYGIAKLDRDSRVVWKDFRHIHHSFDQAENGRIFALDQTVVLPDETRYGNVLGTYLDDGIAIYESDGTFVKRFSLLKRLMDSPWKDVVQFIASTNASAGLGDLLHANDVEVLDADIADKFPFADTGDLLVSLREVNGLLIVDPESEQVKWFRRGYWMRQHDADFLDNGNILVFNNFDLKRAPDGEQASSIIEFNPQTMELVWQYRPAEGESFYTGARGSQQRLPNGNTLITESERYRIFEVTPEGSVVWEYFNHQRVDEEESLVPAVFWATRYSAEEAGFLAENPVKAEGM